MKQGSNGRSSAFTSHICDTYQWRRTPRRCKKGVFEVLWRLDVPFSSQPVSLRRKISPDNICLFVLNAPGPNNNDVAHTEPHSPFHLAWNSSHAGFSVLRTDGDSAAAEHFFNRPKDFILVSSGQSYLARLFFCQLNTSFDI